ncbi:HNH endonuclease [Hymenobacter sedentarius]|nr:HNH endonuclease [Hymenobacter sedentarius]
MAVISHKIIIINNSLAPPNFRPGPPYKGMQKQNEIWRDCEGFAGHQVSNHGNLTKNGEILPLTNSNGYLTATLEGVTKLMHRLVASAFCPKPAGASIVNHLDGSRNNNHATNLEWTTVKGNAVHAAENNMLPTGEQHIRSELTETVVLEIDALLRAGKANGEIADAYGISREVVSKIKAGRTWAKVTGRELAPITRIKAVGKRKLSNDQVTAIRQRVAAGESMRSVAASYSMSHTTIGAIINGETWK